MALALALHKQGQRAQIFEARSRSDVLGDQRVLALSHGSRQILETLGVWAELEATPIAAIHVSERAALGRTRLTAEEEGLPALGYVVAAASLATALAAALQRANLPYRERARVERVACSADTQHLVTSAGNATAQLVVWAEGSAEAVAHDYGQSAVICSLGIAGPHGNTAWERFSTGGPLALLPLGSKLALVWSCENERARLLAQLADADFLAELQGQFGSRLRFVATTPRLVYPLALRLRPRPTAARSVWLGNAAQTLHPVAGQGFNLALRDVAELARSLAAATDPGDPAVLAGYARARRLDRLATIAFTDGLIRLFASPLAPLRVARGAALLALDLAPPLRHFLARRMIFGARAF